MPETNTNHPANPATAPGLSFHGASRLFDLVTGPWALTTPMLAELQEIYATHLRGDKIDLKAVEASLGRPLANQQRGYDVANGVAVLPVQGVISPKANLMTMISGGASAQLLQRDFAQALADPQVSAIVLAMDSPGGSVFGSPDFAQQVLNARGQKPIVAHTDGMMASAAYWIGAAADARYNSGPTNVVGSIGVVARHINKGGQGVTEITAGKYKRIASDTGPLTQEGAAYMQAQVDYYYSLFADFVAQALGVSVDQVLAEMADGQVFIGQQAIDAGLVDGVSTLSDLVDQLASDPQSVTQRAPAKPARRAAPASRATSAGAAAAAINQTEPVPLETTTTTERIHMDRATLEQNHPALFAQLQTEFAAAGAASERTRIASVREQKLPGHEALIERLAFDGKTTGPEAAAAVLGAERERLATAARAHAEDAPAAAASGAAPAREASKSRDTIAAEAAALAKTEGIDFVAALKKLGHAI